MELLVAANMSAKVALIISSILSIENENIFKIILTKHPVDSKI